MEKPKIIQFMDKNGTVRFLEYLHELTQYCEFLEKELEKRTDPVWIKTEDVQKIMGVSAGTLQTLRQKKVIPYSKIGGVLFYNQQKIYELLEFNQIK